jgi:ribose 5-phosphate isomerase B
MTDPGQPSADQVRALVQRIVDQALDADAASPTAVDDGRTVVAIAGDHGGWRLKDAIGAWLDEHGYVVRDCGTHSDDAVDYPDLALAVARMVAEREVCCGIVVDGAGIGSAMAANKVPGVRAANCHDISSARNSREHNYANVLTLGSGFLGTPLALQIVETWLDTEWGAERHGRRVEKISAIERSYTGEPGGKDR